MRFVQRVKQERGAYAVLYAMLCIVMFGAAAFMVDLTGLRSDARAEQSIADFAATSGALDLNPVFGGSPHKACVSAWTYFLLNTPDAPDTPHPCDPFPQVSGCDPLDVLTHDEQNVVGIAGPYEVTITHPVPDGSAYMDGRLDPELDAGPCERIAVRVQRTRQYSFAPLLGSGDGETWASAVARTQSNKGVGEGVALVLLDQTGCKALVASGQAEVHVYGVGTSPGVITLDSAGTQTTGSQDRICKQQQTLQDFVVDAIGTQNSKIFAHAGAPDANGNVIPGIIFDYALMPGQGNAFAYENLDITNGRLSPRPGPGERVTRAPIDWRYNCKAANFCPSAGNGGDYIDQLRAQVGTTGVPAGFQVYGDDPGEACQIPSSGSPLTLTGNWFIDCTGPNGFKTAAPVTFTGGNVVFAGHANIAGSTGALTFNQGSSIDRWVYFRADGDFIKDAQSSLILNRMLVYIDNGRITMGAGSGALTWISPESGNFEDLALWSESAYAHDLGGQANLNVVGTFFTPAAYPFTYTGQGNQFMEQAQFISWRMEVKGQGVLSMRVDPERSTRIPLQGIRLIR